MIVINLFQYLPKHKIHGQNAKPKRSKKKRFNFILWPVASFNVCSYQAALPANILK